MSREETTLIWYKRITDCFRRGREVNMLEDGVWTDIQRSFLRTCNTKVSQYTHTARKTTKLPYILPRMCVSLNFVFLSTKISVHPNTSIPIYVRWIIIHSVIRADVPSGVYKIWRRSCSMKLARKVWEVLMRTTISKVEQLLRHPKIQTGSLQTQTRSAMTALISTYQSVYSV